ncbi:Sec-independent protein translocase subunit TatB [Saccharopolyspora rhizosphaerae]|uniref:Sec-independent protein translocase protein TatB n=1 Tax=Saccharopolyspora rhizosphaerae TaxID=2492662 RepID=A0A426JQZ9_9PSEU|nr:Sec-independent protein translocase protein TatB [Saccharopolyspora rhizosphaerae]RRO15581.1 Sec-independent protein translocase subunit TatB [Saccharopolyspora rhizosphaerae]
MFDSVGWPELLILAMVGLFVLGPERLPQGAAWLGKTIRQVREYATGAREQIRSEIGPEFDELKKPLDELRSVRNFNPKTAVTKHLWDGENPFDEFSKNSSPLSGPPTSSNGHSPAAAPKPPERPLAPGERPPYDTDAT